MERILQIIKRLLPTVVAESIRPLWHYSLAWLGNTYYRQPSRELLVIAVTGTKGKSTVTEIITHILETEGHTVASLSTIQFKIAGVVEKNLYKMTMPGRFFVQQFLRRAVAAGCTHAVVEMTSEGAKQYRHAFIDLDALVFTNLTPEHIESHGSFAHYKAAKLTLANAVANSPKRPRYLVANADDEHGADFLHFPVEHRLPYSLTDLKLYSLQKDGVSVVLGDTTVRAPLLGIFNVYNILAAVTLTQAMGIHMNTISRALRSLPVIKGRVELFYSPETYDKKITVVVDYAHTPNSLEQLYLAFKDVPKIGVLGNTGGGRDTWKRPEMGAIAERYCKQVILTNEDPYDEDPRAIVNAMAKGMTDQSKLTIIMDRRAAIRAALQAAADGDHIIISGKGTDPFIMGALGTKQPWSDAAVVQEELAKLTTAT